MEGMRTRCVAAYDLLINLRLSGSDQVSNTWRLLASSWHWKCPKRPLMKSGK